MRRELLERDFGDTIRETAKYSKFSGSLGHLLDQFLGSLGPLGSLIKSIAGRTGSVPGGIQGDIQNAVDFLNAVAPETLSGPGRRRATTALPPTSKIADQLEAARELLEQHGYEVTAPTKPKQRQPLPSPPPEIEKPYPGGVPRKTSTGSPRKIVEMIVDGQKRRFPVTHPIVTGDNVSDFQSSNVHSFSYDYDKSRLYVRFKAPKGKNRGKGSLYAYEHFPPGLFLKMLSAPSKGTFIWDTIRIRGTVSGHRFDYRLVAVTGGYVPRKATYIGGGNEAFVPRSMRFYNLGSRQYHSMNSPLPYEVLPARGEPNRGTPNRGTPNRGTP